MPRLNEESFEFWMEMEKYYAKLEYDWAGKKDYVWAERCHKLRWRCMELALDSLGCKRA